MKVLYALTALLITFGVPFAFKADAADDSYKFFVSMPNMPEGTSYNEWLASANASNSSSRESESKAIDTGRYIGQSAGSALELGFFTQLASRGTKLKSTPAAFMLIVR